MFFTIVRPLITLFLWIFYPVKVFGKENVIHDGNVVVICNHLGKMDVPYVGYLFKGKTYYLAKKEWFENKFLAWLFGQLGGIPLDREKVDMASTKKALSVLKSGKRLCIFPEGTRNRESTEIQPLHGGAGMFAFKTKAKIIPINIHHKAKLFGKNYVYVGKPFDFSEFDGQKYDSELNDKLTQKMYDELCKAKLELEEILQSKKKVKDKK